MRYVIGLVLVAACGQLHHAAGLSQMAGVWESPAAGFEYAVMEIEKSGEIAWESGGCLDEDSGRSTGIYRDGKLFLSPPLEAYGGDQHRVFHHIRHGGREYLVAEEHLGFVREESDPFGRNFWWGLRRRLRKPVLEKRFSVAGRAAERESLLEEWAQWPVDVDGIGFLVRVANDDPCEDVRRTARFALEQAGKDEYGDVTDPSVSDAAKAALKRIPDPN